MLSRDAILDAGLEILDEGGLAGLTMRALAQRLDVTATALYHYFDGRQELVDAIVDRVCQSIVDAVPEDGSWRARVRSLLETMVAEGFVHRSALALTITEYGKQTPILRIHEAILGILADAGYAEESAVYLKGALLRFCVGHLVIGDLSPGVHWRDLPPAEFPHYRGTGAAHDAFDPAIEFRLGLDALLAAGPR